MVSLLIAGAIYIIWFIVAAVIIGTTHKSVKDINSKFNKLDKDFWK